MSSALGTYVVYLDNIDASAATDIMPGAEFLANAFISYIICETKMKMMKIINPTENWKSTNMCVII